MPNNYTHQLIAEEVLPKEVTKDYLADYFYGAQGPDPFYFYRFIVMGKNNIGKIIHKEKVGDTFNAILEYVRTNPKALAYALGFITHYGADAVFHPYVYSYMRTHGKNKHEEDFIHTQMESDFDTRFLHLRGIEVSEYALPYEEKDIHSDIVSGTIAYVMKKRGVDIQPKFVNTATKHWFRFLRFTTDKNYSKGGFWRTVSKVLKPAERLSALFRRNHNNIDNNYFNTDKKEWQYLCFPDISSTDDVYELFQKSISFCKLLISEFLNAYKLNETLPLELFKINFDGGKGD